MLGPWKARILVYETGKGAYALFFVVCGALRSLRGLKGQGTFMY